MDIEEERKKPGLDSTESEYIFNSFTHTQKVKTGIVRAHAYQTAIFGGDSRSRFLTPSF